MADKLQLLIEANERGLLKGKHKAMYDEAVNRGLIKPSQPEAEGGLSAAFGAGVDKVQELGYRAVKGFTDVGVPEEEQTDAIGRTIGQGGTLSKWAQEGIDRNVKEQQSYEPTVKSYKDIDGLSSLGSYTGELVAGSLPYMAGAATGVGALGMAGGLANEAYEKQPEGEKDEVKAVASGAGQMLLERLGIKVSMGQLGKDILKDGVVETAKRMGRGELVEAVRDPSFAKRILKGAGAEGLTETGQEALAQWGAGKSVDEFEGLDEAFVGGLLVGGVMRTGSETAQKAMGYQQKSAETVKDGADQLVEAGATPEEAIETVKKQQYDSAIKQGFTEVEASAIVARTMKEKFGIDDPLFTAAAEPAQPETQAQTIPEDTETPVFENDDINYDAPTAARQAGFDQTAKAAGQYGDMLTSPAQQSLRDLEAGNNAPTVDERVKAAAFDKSPTPEDRFSPIKYQHEGELLGPDAQNAQGIDNAPIDGQVVPEQGKLPTTEQTKNREMREQAQADLESQPKGIDQKDIIFGEDGRPQQRAAERVKQAGKDSQNLLPQKDIIFADDNSGVNVAKNGEAFKTKRDALLSKEARAARRAGHKTKAVSFDNGFGWTIKGDDGTKQYSEQAAAEQSPETDTVAQNEQGDQAQPAQQEGEALALNVDAAPGKDEDDKNIAVNDKVNGVQVIDTPISELSLSKDIPQFKSGSNSDGVVEPLTGKFDPVGMSPVQVWVRENGNKEIITGRHRFDLAKRDGVESIPAQYHYESDGFTAGDGKRLDAILNIREDKGQVEDYVELFKQDGITEAEAKQYGLLDRATGRTAFKIANSATNETIEAQRTGRISAQAAEAIAEAAPGNERLQILGVKSIADDQRSITFAKNLIHAVSALNTNQDQGGQSGDLFGFDDSAMQEAEQMAKVAAAKQREIRSRLSAIRGAASKPEIAAAEGVNVKDPKALKERTNELANEVKVWDSWHTNPSMVQQIRDSISAPKDGKSAPSTAPITETAIEPESTEQDNGPDMFGDSEPTLFDQEPTTQSNNPEIPDGSTSENVVNFKNLSTVRERVEAFANLQEGDTVIDHRGNKIGVAFAKVRKNARAIRILKAPGDTDTFNIAALAGGGADTVSALDNYYSNQTTVKQPSSKPKPEAKPKPESKLDAAEEKLNNELQGLFGELKDAFSEQKGRLNSGIDPKIAFIVSKIGAVLAAKGVVKFAKWAKQLTKLAKANGIEQDQLKPYLKSAYASISADPVRYNVTDEVADTMDAPREIRALDIDAILSEEVSANESKAEESAEASAENKPSLYIDTYKSSFIVKGDTKPHKDELGKKGLGGIWHRQQQGWMFPPSRRSEVEAWIKSTTGESVTNESVNKDGLEGLIQDNLASINDNRALKKLVSQYHDISTGEVTDAQMKEAQEIVELALVKEAQAIVREGANPKDTYEKLVSLYKNQPNLTTRSSTSMKNQAYSTPAPLAYLSSNLAGIKEDTTVYEPTAGNGMLLIGASQGNAVVNELNDLRVKQLRAQGYKVTQKDATKFVPSEKVNSAIMNPPFGKLDQVVEYDGYKIKSIDHLIAAKALEAIDDNGKASIIIGASKEPGAIGAADRVFFNWLYSNYNVADHFEVSGDLYSRQGAGWPVRVITVNGRQESNKFSPKSGSIERVNSWDELYERYNEAMAAARRPIDRDSDTSANSGSIDTIFTPSVRGENTGATTGVDSGGRTGSGTRDTVVNDGSRGGRGNGDTKLDSNANNANGANGNNTKPSGVDQAVTNGGERVPGNNSAGTDRNDGRESVATGSNYQAPYTTQSGGSNEAVLTPVNMAEASKNSLRAIEGAVGAIDNYVMDKLGYKTKDELYNSFMGLQIDTVAAAIYNAEKKNKGIIIADQTGVGKGRQAAGIIRYAMRSGKTPIFITVKDNLFTDMYDDLQDIGTDNAAPLIVNQDAFIKSGDQKIFKTQSRAKHVSLIDEIINTGKLPDDNNMLFITYSQLDGKRQRALIEALKDNAYFVMDEAHNAAGERVKKTKGQTRITRAGFLYGAIENSPVAYLSATYAKRPDNLPVFYRTDLMDSVDKPEDLIEAAATGGEALQTIIAGMLAETGQLYRRERSFEGIEIKTTLDETNKAKHTDISDKVTTGLRAIVSADKAFHDLSVDAINQKLQEEGMSASGAGNKADASFNHTNFTSIGHNFISQLLMGLKVDTVADRAIEMHKANQKPVIALQNTMGSFLSEFVADNGLEPGDVIDADYRDVMLRALERTRRVSVKDKAGDSKSVDVPLSYLDPYVQSLYHEAENVINNLDISDMPISPIDYVRNKLESAGIKTSEITGRKYRIDYSSGEPVLDVITTAEQKDKRGTVDKFNNGELDSLVLNVAGSTGLSIHAAEKFSDTRKRAMIVMQPMADINILMQMLGRINRTGQVEKPFYEFPTLSIPAEKRPAAKTSQKLKSLNANTSANTDSDVSLNSVDMMNKYGDKVMTEYLKDNGSVASSLGIPQPAAEGPVAGLYEKATGRMALLPVSKQEAIYADIEAEYKDLIDYLDSTGQNDLSPQMLNLDARIIDSKVIYEGKNPETTFGGNTFLHQVDAKYQGKPPTADEVIKAIAKAGDPTKLKDKIISSKSGDTKYITDLESRLSTARADLENAQVNDKDAVPDLDVKVMGLENQVQTFNDQKRAMESALNEYQVGSHFAIQLPEEKVNAVVVGIKDSHKIGKGNPYTPGKLKISLMLNSGSRQISLPLSQLKGDEIYAHKISKGSEQEIRNEFKFDPLRDTDRREIRYIATGNLIMGSKEVKGRIATFTDKEGKTHQGILLPKNYEGKEFSSAGSSKTFSMRDGDTLAKFLNAARTKLEGAGLLDTTKAVSIKPVGENDWSITIPKANKLSIVKSVKFDQDLIDAMGTDFYGSNASMTARFNKRRLKAVMNQLTKLVTIQGQGSYRDDWVKAGGNAEPKAPKSFSQDIKFSKSKVKKNAQGVAKDKAEKIADDFIKSLEGANGIKVRILETTAEAEQMWRMSLEGATVKGAYSEMSNTVYIIAENMDSIEDLKQTLAHETIAHGGLDTVIGKEAKQEFIDRIKKTKGRKAFEKYWKDANNDYWDASEDVKAEEIFARFVENEPSKGEVKYWWNALKRFIRKQLDKLGIVYREDDEITSMRDMLESIVRGFKAQRDPVGQKESSLTYSQSGKKLSKSDNFKEWFADSKVVDNKGEPLIVYHGTGAKFKSFDKSKLGSLTGASSAGLGFFFTSNKSMAYSFQEEAEHAAMKSEAILAELDKLPAQKRIDLFDDLDMGQHHGYLEYASKDDQAEIISDAMSDIAETLEQDASEHPADRSNYLPTVKKYLSNDFFNSGEIKETYLKIENPLVIQFDEGSFEDSAVTAAIKKAANNGNDGVIFKNMIDGISKDDKGNGFDHVSDVYVALEPQQIKTASNLMFSRTADEDTRTPKQKLGLEEQAAKTFSDMAKDKVNETVDTLKSSPFWNRLNEGIFDGLSGIKNAEIAAGVTDPNRQGYVSARLASGLADVLHGVFNYGAPQWRDGIVQRKEGTKGLLEVFGMVGDDLNNWLAWMGAHRAEQLKAQGRENNLTDNDIAELKALANGKERLFEQTRLEYNKINSAILDMAQQAGLLSEAQRSGFDEEYYVPFFRDMGETDPEMDEIKRMIVEPHTRKGISGQSAQLKTLKGGEQSTKDLLENIISRQSTFIDASLKNKAMQEVVNNLDGTDYMKAESSEDIASLSQQDLNKLGKVKVMVDGKPQAYVVSDPALLRALIQVNDVGSQSLFNRLGRSAKRFLTAGITLSPDFIFKNFVRDAAHAWMINKDDFKFGTDSIKGLKKAFKEDEAYRDLIFSGAAFQGGYIHGADPEAGAQQIRRALRSKGLTSKEIEGYMATVVTSGATLLEKYRGISDKVENANRLSTYEAAIANGKSKRQAAYEAKDLMDYSLKGNFKLIGTMIDTLPFFNARLQGMSKLVRAAKASNDDRVLRVLSANLAMKGIKVAAFSLALAAMNDDDEEYQKLEDWDKDMNWHFFVDGEHMRIPKPFELGIIFGTMPERLFHYGTGTQTDKDLGKAVANAVWNTMSMNPIPQMFLPATEVLINKSFFKGSPIEGMADQNKQAEDRYSAYTSDTVKAIAQQFGVSPKKVEHLIKGYTGTIGGYVLGASDIVARMMTGKVPPETPVSRYPVVKAFYQGSGPKTNTKFATDFYEALDAANQAYGSYKRAMELGDTARQQELIEKDGQKLRSKATLAKVQRMISKLRKMQKAINDNDKLDGKQKREKLDDVQRKINAIYHKAYVTLNLGEW